VVRAETAAAGRQRCIVALVDDGPKGAHSEQENEQDGEDAPHLAFMLHELWSGKPF
jgi:hypothetical protein